MAETLKPLEKDKKKEGFSRKEWEEGTQGAKAHIKKLKYVHQIDDEWLRKLMNLRGLSYKEFPRGFLH